MAPRSEFQGSVVIPKRSASLHNSRSSLVIKARHAVLARAASWPRLPSSQFTSGIAFVPKPGEILAAGLPSVAERSELMTAVTGPRSILKSSKQVRSVDNPPSNRSVHFPLRVLLWEAAVSNSTIEMTDLVEKVRPRAAEGSLLSKISMDGAFDTMEDDFPLDVCNFEGVSLLHVCCLNGNEYLVRLLLSRGATPNLVDCDGWAPIHAAASVGRLDIVYDLIAAGAVIPSIEATEHMEGLSAATDNKTVLSIIDELRAANSTAV